MAMSSGGASAATTASVSPSSHAGPTATRRRVDPTDKSSNFPDYYDEEDNSSGSSTAHHHHYYNHSHHPVIRYLLLRRKLFFFLPETWLLGLEDGCHWTQSVRSGKNVGRKIFAVLMVVVVVSVFFKVSFLGHHHMEKRAENGLVIIHAFKDDWAAAQRAVTETEAAAMPKRVL